MKIIQSMKRFFMKNERDCLNAMQILENSKDDLCLRGSLTFVYGDYQSRKSGKHPFADTASSVSK